MIIMIPVKVIRAAIQNGVANVKNLEDEESANFPPTNGPMIKPRHTKKLIHPK
jgi:hypothetical protein